MTISFFTRGGGVIGLGFNVELFLKSYPFVFEDLKKFS